MSEAFVLGRFARNRSVTLTTMLGLWVVAVIVGIGSGAVVIAPARIFELMAGMVQPLDALDAAARSERSVIFDIRLPRVILASAAGAALAMSGTAMQGLFRNPLADPGLIGVSSGAALGATLCIALGVATLPALSGLLGASAIAVGAFVGALAAAALVLSLATRDGRTSTLTMLLTGIAVTSMSGAIIGWLVYASTDSQLRNITLWTMGGLGGATWSTAALASVVVIAGYAVLRRSAAKLDLLQLGEAEAWHLGVDVERLKRKVVALVALVVGTVVAFGGLIGFVGLVVPHIVRSLLGPSHNTLLPASAVAGAVLLVLADVLARTLVAPAEMPIGILTAAVGAPTFVHILRRRERLGGLR